jgi:hypothetical protein
MSGFLQRTTTEEDRLPENPNTGPESLHDGDLIEEDSEIRRRF